MSKPNIVVRLQDPKFPATGIVVARDVEFDRYMALRSSGPDGAVDPALRLWRGVAEVGETVSLCACDGACMLCDDAGLRHEA